MLSYAYILVNDSFILLQSAWPVAKAKSLLEHPNFSHVIVETLDTQSYYYLYKSKDITKLLSTADSEQTLQNTLNLDEATAMPVVDAYENASQVEALGHCIITDETRLIGFFDASVPLSQRPMRGESDPILQPSEQITRSLITDFPEQVALNDTVSLLVSLSAESLTKHDLTVALPLGVTIDIVIQARRHFSIEGKTEGQLVITDEDETLPLQFKLKATALGPGQIQVWAFHDGQPLGTVKLSPLVMKEIAEDMRAEQQHPLGHISIVQPDLLLLILEHEYRGQPAVTVRLSAKEPSWGLNFKPYGPISLKTEPLAFFQQFFKDIENLKIDATTARRLETKGTNLFEQLFPEALQTLLWKLKDRIQSVQIQSDEPWIPWELCRLVGQDDNGRIAEGGFFCEAFMITRWIPGIPCHPKLTLNKLALVVPTDSRLSKAKEEQDYLLSLQSDQREVTSIPANFRDVIEAVASSQYDAWHFAGHGCFRALDPNRSGIKLENQEEFGAENLSGIVRNLGKTYHPLIFLNACQVGRGALSLTDIGGFAAQSLRAGAGAFIGAYWNVFDHSAHRFSSTFYDQLLAGQTIGQAIREARLAIKQIGDPTWLAYTVYAEPLAVVVDRHLSGGYS